MLRLICLLWGICIFYGTFAQQAVLPIPQNFKYPIEGRLAIDVSQGVPGSLWMVYSDRDHNPIYTSSKGEIRNGSLAFLEAGYVVDVKGEYMHLYTDPEISVRGGLSAKAKEIGWVHKDKVLMWTHCLMHPNKVARKSMILNQVSSNGASSVTELKAQVLRFATNPQRSVVSDRESRLFEIFYVYKEEGNSLLLGQGYSCAGTEKVKQTILGWVPKSRVVPWDYRIATEPNWYHEGAEERKKKGKSAQVFRTKEDAQKYKRNESAAAYWKADTYGNRPSGYWRRFPILGKTDDIWKVGLMGSVKTSTGLAVNNVKLMEKITELEKRKRKINIAFVVDGTQSMGNYFKATTQAIQNAVNELSVMYGKQNQNTLRYGAVVFRDYAEKDRKIELRSLTSNPNQIISFLNAIEAKDYFDRDKPEALYYGLKNTLEHIGFKENEANFIILIGDVGTHNRLDPTQVSEKTLQDLLVKYSCNVIAFQANRASHPTYEDFLNQTKRLILATAKKKYADSKGVMNLTKLQSPLPSWQSFGNSYYLNQGAIYGKILYPNKGMSLSPSKLSKEVQDAIIQSNKYIDKIIGDINASVGSGGEGEALEVGPYTPAVLDFLREALNDSELRLIGEEKFQFYMPGYTSPTVDGVEAPVFRYVLFLTRTELGQLVHEMSELSETEVSEGTQIKLLIDVWCEILGSHLGDQYDCNQIGEMTTEELVDLAYGLPVSSGLLSGLKLNEISTLSSEQLAAYIKEVDTKRAELHNIFMQNDYEYSFSSNGQVYYWIDGALLP